MKKIIITFALLFVPFLLHAGENDPASLNNIMTNADLSFGEYENRFLTQKKSAVGKPFEISVFCQSKPKTPDGGFVFTLLDENNQVIPKTKSGRYIHLLGYGNLISKMHEGERYKVTGILVEDQGFYSAFVVYAKSIKKIANKSQ